MRETRPDPYFTVISIIIAIYNGEKTLQRCIDSVVNQTYKNIELIIIDGLSTDGTVDIIRKNNDNIFFWESKSDRGIAHAWNKGIERATGDWLYFLGADDYLYNDDIIESVALKIKQCSEKPLIFYGTVMYCDGEKRMVLGESWEVASAKLKNGMCIPHQGMFHHKEIFRKCDGFDERFRIASDYHLIMRSLKFASPIFIDGLLVAYMYAGGLSTCRYKRWRVLKEFREVQKEMNIPISFGFIYKQLLAQLFRLFRIS